MKGLRILVMGEEQLRPAFLEDLKKVLCVETVQVISLKNFIDSLAEVAKMPLLVVSSKTRPTRPNNGHGQRITALTSQPRPRPRFQAKRARR